LNDLDVNSRNIENATRQNAGSSVKEWFDASRTKSAAAHQTSAPIGDSLAVTLGGLFQTAKENRWTIILIMLLGCIGGVFKAVLETPVYQASLTMAVEPSSIRTPIAFMKLNMNF